MTIGKFYSVTYRNGEGIESTRVVEVVEIFAWGIKVNTENGFRSMSFSGILNVESI